MEKTDAQLRKQVAEQLRWDSRIYQGKIQVKVKNGVVTLTGQVPTFFAKRAATDDVFKVGGYKAILNGVKIKPIKRFTDKEIKESIKRALFWNLLLDEDDIQVKVKDGKVTLKGTVSFFWQKESAENSASVNGVVNITNKIVVVPTRNIADRSIAKDIVKAMERDESVDVNDVDVKVVDRRVTLKGKVPSRTAYHSAVKDVIYTWGVIDMVNKLTIKS